MKLFIANLWLLVLALAFCVIALVDAKTSLGEQLLGGSELPDNVYRMMNGQIFDFRPKPAVPKPHVFIATTPLDPAIGIKPPTLLLAGLNEEHLNLGYIKYFKGGQTQEANEFAKKLNVHLPMTLANPSSENLCLFGHVANIMNTSIDVRKPFLINDMEKALPLPGHTTVQIGNWIPNSGIVRYQGRMHAVPDCSEDCRDCPSEGSAVHTLVEWAYFDGFDGKDQEFWSNLSNGMCSHFGSP